MFDGSHEQSPGRRLFELVAFRFSLVGEGREFGDKEGEFGEPSVLIFLAAVGCAGVN